MSFDPNAPTASHEALADITAMSTNFNALRNCESSATEPSNLVAGMFWYDTTANILKLRNEANSAWQNVWDFGNNRLPLNVLAPGELTADAGGRAKMANLYIVDALVNDVAFGKITGTITPSDGTVSTAKLGDAAVAQAKLKSSTGTVSVASTSGISVSRVTLPGGNYGFCPDFDYVTTDSTNTHAWAACLGWWEYAGTAPNFYFTLLDRQTLGANNSGWVTMATLLAYWDGAGTVTTYARQRYVTASPPYNLGDGDIPLFIFALVDNSSGNIESLYIAQDPPWAYNGPTDIRPDYTDSITRKNYKHLLKLSHNFKDMDNPVKLKKIREEVKNPQHKWVEIDQAYKNKDMDLIPHPFIGNNLTGKTIVLLNPFESVLYDLYEFHELSLLGQDINISDFLYKQYITINNIDNENIKRPMGVMVVTPKWKNT